MEISKKTLESKIAELATSATDEGLQRVARMMLSRLTAIPMDEILAKVPGDTMAAKAELIGVTRPAVWYWRHGHNRPRGKAARRIAQITGLSVDEIRGRDA